MNGDNILSIRCHPSPTLSDIGGIRITCKYIQEVYEIFDLLKSRKDIEIFWIKDYIENPKESGYQSVHLLVKVPVVDGKDTKL